MAGTKGNSGGKRDGAGRPPKAITIHVGQIEREDSMITSSYFEIDEDKMHEVGKIIAANGINYRKAVAFVLADWPEGQEHQAWLNKANAQEIADWVVAGS